MAYFSYVLYSVEHDKIYVGYTSDLQNRLLSHNQLATKGYTIRYRPWILFFFEEFPSKSMAIKREKELKSSRGRTFIWEKIRLHYPVQL